MRKLMIAAALASTAVGTPALARDGSAYVGLDAGLLRPSPLKIRLTTSSGTFENAIRVRHKLGIDADAVFGYDFGMFRLEGELGYKDAKTKNATLSPAALSRFDPATTPTFFVADGRTRAVSAMLNALVDFGSADAANFSIGAGVGGARVRSRAGLEGNTTLNYTTTNESALAWQVLAELRGPISTNLDIGVKARYFETGTLNFGPFCVTTCQPTFYLHTKYRSASLLAGLTYNFYSPPPPPPPPPPAPPPPPPAPATQTCPDGSVILATDTCPAPPPPPPPPPPAPERG